jgi:hypothetical protein
MDRMGRGMKIGCTNKRDGEAIREKGRKEIGKLVIQRNKEIIYTVIFERENPCLFLKKYREPFNAKT